MARAYDAKAPLANPTSKDGRYRFIATFKPLPWQEKALNDKAPVILLTGSAGGGKSRTAYEKVHAFCLHYPGATAVVLRKKATDADTSVVLALTKKIIGDDPRVTHNKQAGIFYYDNGSVIIYTGMKDESARLGLRSIGIEGGIDICLMEEGIEFEETDFNEVTGRMRGNVAGWNQVIVCTNPDVPGHWINRRLIKGGEASVHYSSESDNPYNPHTYTQTLGRMTGTDGSRMRDGLWVEGSGLVIDTWLDRYMISDSSDGGGNVTDEAEYIEDGGTVVVFADDGYAGEWDKKTNMFTDVSHPRVFLLAQLRSDGRIAIFSESYAIKTQAAQHLIDLKSLTEDSNWPWPRTGHFDKSAASLSGAMRQAGIVHLYKGPSSVEESIKELVAACGRDENGWRRVIVHPRCRLLRLELSSYSKGSDGKPLKKLDNGPDALRYGVWNIIRGPGKPVSVSANTEGSNIDIEAIRRRVSDVYRKHTQGVQP
jgi:phage terminase large subunit